MPRRHQDRRHLAEPLEPRIFLAAAPGDNSDNGGSSGASDGDGRSPRIEFVVTTTIDEDNGTIDPSAGTGTSLREAINWANAFPGTDTITFNLPGTAPHTIELASALPELMSDLTIQGPGAGLLSVRRNTGGEYHIFRIHSYGNVILSGMTISNGRAFSGGGVYNAGSLLVTESVISGNSATSEYGGGGIYNVGALRLSNSTVSENTARLGAGIVNFGLSATMTLSASTVWGNASSEDAGGIGNAGTLRVINSTVSGNSARWHGGGIYNAYSLDLTNTTVTNNRADNGGVGSGSGGGIYTVPGTTTANNSIISGNFRGAAPSTTADNIAGSFGGSFNLIGGNALLGPLQDNGGPTLTHALEAASPAINAGSNALAVDQFNFPLITDQRGVGFPRIISGTVDIGAIERRPIESLIVTTLVDENNGTSDPAFGTGTSLREAIIWAHTNPGTDTITFNLPGAGPYTLNLTEPLPDLASDLSIQGLGANVLTLRRHTGGNYRIFTVLSGRTVNLSGMTMTGGRDVYGGGVANYGTLTLAEITVSGNATLSYDGGGIYNAGTLTLSNSIVEGNSSSQFGGGIYNISTVTITNSTVSGNSAFSGGGGIDNSGMATVSGSTISGNFTFGTGAGVINTGMLSLTGSTISDNQAFMGGGGIVNNFGSTLTVLNSAVTGNSADYGGGIDNGGTLRLINSTVSGNAAGAHGGGIYSSSALSLTNATVTNNRADSADNGFGAGGGIHNENGTATANNSIISGNFLGPAPSATPNDVAGPLAGSFNLIGGNALLGPLANNGGSTATHAPLLGSPAVNSGSNALAIDPLGSPLATDQRGAGFPRIIGGTVDIGALEIQLVESLIVTTLADENDGTSDPALGTGTSLREAINWANTKSGTDTITFNLPGAGPHTINLTSVLPDLASNLNISGPGANLLTVRRDTGGEYRIFTVPAGNTVNLSGMTISNGRAHEGGGVLNRGTLTLNQVIVSGNTSTGSGGGIAVETPAVLTLQNTLVTGNLAIGGVGGGGIIGGGTITLNNSTVSENISTVEAGGIYTGFNLTLNNSTVSNNSASLVGGGIFSFGTVSISNSTISGNSAGVRGGFIYNLGTLNVSNSTVTGNSAVGDGGAIYNGTTPGYTGTIALTNATLTGNRADSDGDGTGAGGALIVAAGTARMNNTLIADNFRGTGAATEDDIVGSVDAANSKFNLLGTGGSGGLVNGVNGNLVGIANPLLGPLANNGGPTQTHALLALSPALQRGSNALALDPQGNPLTTDQRGTGFPRVSGPAVDIGAFEAFTAPSTASATFANITSEATTYTFTVTFSSTQSINVSTLDDNDIRVTGPGGFNQLATFVSATPSGNAPSIAATYQVTGPGGLFDTPDNGTYTVAVQADQVANLYGGFVSAGNLGTFQVLIPGVYVVTNLNNSGAGSLRQAILNSNASPGLLDQIVFQSGLTGAINLQATSGQLNITDSVNITGPGAARITVNGQNAVRVFTINGAGLLEVTISGLTISGGNGVSVSGQSPREGGAIRLDSVNLTLDGVVVSGNAVTSGGAARGGGIAAMAPSTITIRNSAILQNAADRGGGIYFGTAGWLNVESSTIANNSGGGVYFNSGGSLQMLNSTVSDNTASETDGGGGIHFSGNVTAGGFVVRNSTIAMNSASATGGSTGGGGIVLRNLSGTVLVQNSTITGNSSASTTNSQGEGGGGIALPGGGSNSILILENTIVSGNTAANARHDISSRSSAPVSAKFSAIGVANGFTLAPGSADNLPFGTNLMLGPLANNGGPTLTCLPAADSPLINAGSNALIPPGVTTDQRGQGFPRVVDATVDIGSVERSLTVTNSTFDFLSSQSLLFSFNEPVSFPSGIAAAFTLHNLTTNTSEPFNAAHNSPTTVVLRPVGAFFSDGNFRATVIAGNVTGAGGPMAANVEFEFFFLNGDANRDGRVNLADFNILAANFGQSNRTFAEGNFDYDAAGFVNLVDFNILAGRFGRTLAGASANPAGSSLFNDRRINVDHVDWLELLLRGE